MFLSPTDAMIAASRVNYAAIVFARQDMLSYRHDSENQTPKGAFVMTVQSLRSQLHNQVDEWPEDILKEVIDFAAFVLARRRFGASFADWTEQDWQQFTLNQLFRDGDEEVQYSLHDAQEVYHR